MKRPLIVAAAVAALVLTGTGVALAQDANDPTCGAAVQAVASFDRADLTAKTTNRDAARKAAADAQKEADRWQARVLEQQAKADNAHDAFIKADNASKVVGIPTADRDHLRIDAEAKRVERDAARAEVDKALIARDAAKGVVRSQQLLAEAAGKRVDALQADLAKLEKTRDEVCAPIPGRNGTNGTDGQNAEQNNGSTSNNGSNSGGSTSNGTSSNPGPITYSQVESVPSGGVETGA